MQVVILSFFILISQVFPYAALAQNTSGIIYGKYANIRTAPTVVNTKILTQAMRGTKVEILDKTPEKIRIGDIDGYWYKIDLVEEGIQGWVFDRYVALEGSPHIESFLKDVLDSLYYFRPEMENQLVAIKKLGKRTIFTQLKKYNPRFLHYIGYRLLLERNALAFPCLIAFLDPAAMSENSKDANYQFTWEVLQRLTPKILVTNRYQSFRTWWLRNWGTIRVDIPRTEMATIFKRIRENETLSYRTK